MPMNCSKISNRFLKQNLYFLQMICRSLNQGNTLEEINTSLLNMPKDYALGHCVAKYICVSADIAIYFNNIVFLIKYC